MSEAFTLPQDTQTALATPIGEDMLLIAGLCDAMPAQVPVLLNGDPAMAIDATVITWPRADAPPEAATGFVALLTRPPASRVRLTSVILRRPRSPLRFALMRKAVALPALMQAIAADSGGGLPGLIDGLVAALLSEADNPRRLAAAAALVRMVAKPDGVVEVVGALDSGELFLQGWCRGKPSERTRLLVAADGLMAGEMVGAVLPRQDLGEDAQGFAALLTPSRPVDPTQLRELFLRGPEGWRLIEMYERCVLVNTMAVPAHVRDVLPRVQASGAALTALRRAGERYDGRDSVSTLRLPVRLGIDMSSLVPGAGVLVGGWLLDPERHVREIRVRAGSGAHAIHEGLVRLSRPDVTAAFADDGLFRGKLDAERQDHGFLAFAPGLNEASEKPVYLELTLRDGAVVFYPLQPARSLSRRALERLLAVLAPLGATASLAIERHIGPMLQAATPPAPRIAETRDHAFDDAGAPLVLAVAATADVEQIATTLALLGLDPMTQATPIVVAAPIEAFDAIAGEVQRLAGFYELSLRLVCAEGVTDACDALEIAAHATKAEAIAFLAPGVLPRTPGWLGSLERAWRARGGRVLVSPTVVFEDESIRYAGTWLDRRNGEARLVDRQLGFPRQALTQTGATDVVAGTLACCLVSRAAIETAGLFSRSYLGVTDKARDLCLKLKLAGTPSLWLPDVDVMAADEEVGAGLPAWKRLAERIDRWCFNRRWSLLVSNMRG